MESKRLEKKLNSLFWCVLTALPLIFLIIVYIVALPQCAKNFDWVNNDWIDFITYSMDGDSLYNTALNSFDNMSISFIRDTFVRVFDDTFGVSNYDFIAYLFGWMLSVQIYHLIYDVLKFIIYWCHSLIEKAYI